MILTFRDRGTEDIFNGVGSKAARQRCPQDAWKRAAAKLDRLNIAVRLDDLREPPGNRLHRLHGDREGQHALRINDQYRACFRWTGEGAEDVEITDYH